MSKYLILSIFLSILGCKAPKSVSYENGSEEISCFTQREIPGMPNEKPKTYINCRLEGDQIRWDSLLFKNNSYSLNRLDKEVKVELKESDRGELPHELMVFYSKENRNFKKIIDKVDSKEDLYLP